MPFEQSGRYRTTGDLAATLNVSYDLARDLVIAEKDGIVEISHPTRGKRPKILRRIRQDAFDRIIQKHTKGGH